MSGWETLYGRLAAARSAVEAGSERSGEAMEGILKRRAERMVRPQENAGTAGTRDYLLARVDGKEIAVESSWVWEVARPQAVLEVPGAPDRVEGVFNLRGRMIPVMALPGSGGASGAAGAATLLAVVLADGSRLAAFLASEVSGVKSYDPSAIGPLLGAPSEGILGMTPGGERVLDAARLFDDMPART